MPTAPTTCPTYQHKEPTPGPSVALFLIEGQKDRMKAQGVKVVSGLFYPHFSFLSVFLNFSLFCFISFLIPVT